METKWNLDGIWGQVIVYVNLSASELEITK